LLFKSRARIRKEYRPDAYSLSNSVSTGIVLSSGTILAPLPLVGFSCR